ncbi:MAG: hypothetical protein Q9162_005392 [Coniocarpon cinnabarinum]
MPKWDYINFKYVMKDFIEQYQWNSADCNSQNLSLFSSIEGSFLRTNGSGLLTLQALLRAIQPLKLSTYDGGSLRGRQLVGEGASYRVLRCKDSHGRAIAAKEVKLPLGDSNPPLFAKRVECVLKDLEVMHHAPIAHHNNIVNLLGYGWGLHKEGPLPFLVTELSDHGSMRQFLALTSALDSAAKYKLCCDVASGLHALHTSKVCHGDLKLENVLVFYEYVQSEKKRRRGSRFVAKISDFGLSCLFTNSQAYGAKQLYQGTAGYLAPELHRPVRQELEFSKCDMWALGLLVWETLADGRRYIDLPETQELLKDPGVQTSSSPDERRTPSPFENHFAKLANNNTASNPISTETTVQEEEGWAYENYLPQNTSRVPYQAKVQMVADSACTATEASKYSTAAARASLYVAMAYANGFGVEKSSQEFIVWLKKSSMHGSTAAQSLLDICEHPPQSSRLILNETTLGWSSNGRLPQMALLSPSQFSCPAQEVDLISSASMLSKNGCNILHYIALYLQPENALLESRSSQTPQDFPDDSARSQRRELITRIVQGNIHCINDSPIKEQIPSTYFPFSLSGSPLAFATAWRDIEVMDALLAAGASPMGAVSEAFSPAEVSPLRSAIAGYLLDEFDILWKACMSVQGKQNLQACLMKVPEKIEMLVASLAQKSIAERIALHGLRWEPRRHAMIIRILQCFNELDLLVEAHQSQCMASLYGAIGRVISLGDVETGFEIFDHMCSNNELGLEVTKPHSHRLKSLAIELACEGFLSDSESVKYLQFARQIDSRSCTDGQIWRSLVIRQRKALFLHQIDVGSRIDTIDESGRTVLHYMAENEFPDPYVFQRVLDQSKAISLADYNGVTPLHLAAMHDIDSRVRQLLAAGADACAEDGARRSVLQNAFRSHTGSAVRLIVEYLPPQQRLLRLVNSYAHAKGRPEMLSSSSGDQRMVLHAASRLASVELVETLLSYGATIDELDDEYNSPLHKVFESSCGDVDAVIACAKLLCNAGTPLHRQNKSGETALHIAAQTWRDPDLAKILSSINAGGTVINIPDICGQSVLHIVSKFGNASAVSTLLEQGALCSLYDNRGRSSLHVCAEAEVGSGAAMLEQHVKVAQILVQNGAKILAQDEKDQHALDYAVNNGKTRLAHHLIQQINGNINSGLRRCCYIHGDAILRPWRAAIEKGFWAMVSSFLLHIDRTELDLNALWWPVGARLFRHAVVTHDEELLLLFGIPKTEDLGFSSCYSLSADHDDTTFRSLRSQMTFAHYLFSPWSGDKLTEPQWDAFQRKSFEDTVNPLKVHSLLDEKPLSYLLDTANFIVSWPSPVLSSYFGAENVEEIVGKLCIDKPALCEKNIRSELVLADYPLDHLNNHAQNVDVEDYERKGHEWRKQCQKLQRRIRELPYQSRIYCILNAEYRIYRGRHLLSRSL